MSRSDDEIRALRAENERLQAVIAVMDDDADLALIDRDEAIEAESRAADRIAAERDALLERAQRLEGQLAKHRDAMVAHMHRADAAEERAQRAEAERDAALEVATSAEPLAEVRELWQRALEREGNLASAVADVVWKATQYGETEDGDTYAYLVPKGAMHRLVGVAQSNGAHVPVAFRAALAAEPSERVAAEGWGQA